jgi:hypothetical protein
MSRPYTGTKDGVARGARPGTKQFQALMVFLFQMRSLGIYANRPVRGGSSLSVHATGRACDLGGSEDKIIRAINFLSTSPDELGVEAVHDYGNRVMPGKYGAAWTDATVQRLEGRIPTHHRLTRCQMGPLRNLPTMADDPDAVTAAFTDILNRIVAALEGN